MTWVRLDDSYVEQLEMVRAGPIGLALHTAGLCYSNRCRTDGHIPAAKARHLLELDDPDAVIDALIGAGAWRRVDGGYQLVFHLEHQPTRDQAERLSRQRAAAGRKGGSSRRSSKPKKAAGGSRSRAPKCKHGNADVTAEDGGKTCLECDAESLGPKSGANTEASASDLLQATREPSAAFRLEPRPLVSDETRFAVAVAR